MCRTQSEWPYSEPGVLLLHSPYTPGLYLCHLAFLNLPHCFLSESQGCGSHILSRVLTSVGEVEPCLCQVCPLLQARMKSAQVIPRILLEPSRATMV